MQQQPAVLLAVQAVVAVQRTVSALRDGFSRVFPQLQDVSKEVGSAWHEWGTGELAVVCGMRRCRAAARLLALACAGEEASSGVQKQTSL